MELGSWGTRTRLAEQGDGLADTCFLMVEFLVEVGCWWARELARESEYFEEQVERLSAIEMVSFW